MKKIFCFGLLLMIAVTTKAQSFLERVKEKADTMSCADPKTTDPVAINATMLNDKTSDSIAVIVKVAIYSGWHIYALVPEDMPYISTQFILRSADGNDIPAEWVKSTPKPSLTDTGVLVYEDKASFICFLKKADKIGGMQAGLYYQTCDVHQCLPPKEITLKL